MESTPADVLGQVRKNLDDIESEPLVDMRAVLVLCDSVRLLAGLVERLLPVEVEFPGIPV
jgi:hypothetical protein